VTLLFQFPIRGSLFTFVTFCCWHIQSRCLFTFTFSPLQTFTLVLFWWFHHIYIVRPTLLLSYNFTHYIVGGSVVCLQYYIWRCCYIRVTFHFVVVHSFCTFTIHLIHLFCSFPLFHIHIDTFGICCSHFAHIVYLFDLFAVFIHYIWYTFYIYCFSYLFYHLLNVVTLLFLCWLTLLLTVLLMVISIWPVVPVTFIVYLPDIYLFRRLHWVNWWLFDCCIHSIRWCWHFDLVIPGGDPHLFIMIVDVDDDLFVTVLPWFGVLFLTIDPHCRT